MSLYQKLTELHNSDIYPFHMPGHKRNMSGDELEELYNIDITEIDGFDNLHHAQGILKTIQDTANEIYGGDRTWISVNGSTAGILSAISAACNDGDSIILDRRSHKAAYNACALKNLKVSFLYPELDRYEGLLAGRITCDEVRKAMDDNREAKAVFITSPSYDGIISDIRGIADICHERNIPLIVDAAHGAHFVLDKRFGTQAIELGADIAIHSIHKTLPAPTQTALVSIKSKLIDEKKLANYMSIYQTSSPSYVLMAGIEKCLDIMINNKEKLNQSYFDRLDTFLSKIKCLNNISVSSFDEYKDPSKIIIYSRMDSKKINGIWIGTILRRQFNIEPEMITPAYVCCLSTVMDTDEGFDRLAEALIQMDEIADLMPEAEQGENSMGTVLESVTNLFCDEKEGAVELTGECRMRDSLEKEAQWIELIKSEGYYSAGFVQVYPPGIPILIPGERIRDKHIDMLCRYIECNLMVEGIEDNGLWILK